MEFSYGIVDEAIITGFDFFRTGIDFLDLTFVIFDVFRLFGSRTITADFVLGFSSRTFQEVFVYGLIRDFTLESCLELLKGFLQGICFFGRIKDFVGGFYWNIHQGSFRFWNLFYEISRTPCLGFCLECVIKGFGLWNLFSEELFAFKYLDLSSREPLPNFDFDLKLLCL